jgi:PPOX class probable F420-dependent enzyme
MPLAPGLDAMLARSNPAVVATVRPDGSPHTVGTWYAWDGARILMNMDEGRARLRHMRDNPRVSLTVFDGENWNQHVTLFGSIVALVPDEGMREIDRIASHYGREPFRRGLHRVNAWMAPERWASWPPPDRWTSWPG